jgi:hypothetical protein
MVCWLVGSVYRVELISEKCRRFESKDVHVVIVSIYILLAYLFCILWQVSSAQ